MPGTSAEFNARQLQRILHEYERVSQSGNDLRRPMRTIGQILKSKIQMGFSRSVDPYGTPWAPITYRRGRPLRDTGRLMNSITYRAKQRSVLVGTNVEYAAIHQFGGPRRHGQQTPVARMFLPSERRGLPQSWQQDIINRISQHILGE